MVVFDIDGTLLDSAPGIVACFIAALESVGFDPPDASELRRDLGPPVEDVFTTLGLAGEHLGAAVSTYRQLYHRFGLQQSIPYEGIAEVLQTLQAAGTVLATATAKRTETAQAILSHHQLTQCFDVVNGTDDLHRTKSETLSHTLALLGHPRTDTVVMVGDRHSDVRAARACGVRPIAVSWGYGSGAELASTGATTIRRPPELLEVLGRANG